MNIKEIQDTSNQLKKNCTCPKCKEHYKLENISVVASTKQEGVFEMICSKCKTQVLISTIKVVKERKHRSINKKDITSIKSFLNTFDGNFEKIFKNEK